MKEKLKKFMISLMVLLAVLVVSEISANIVVYYSLNIERNEYLSYYKKNQKLKSATWLLKFTPHPYFGYEHERIRDFEKAKFNKENEFVIGILGGSLGGMFGNYIEKHTELFDGFRNFVPNLGDKDIVIANLAVGGGKQPQQFLMSALFIDKLDMIINIDGFNDASSAHFLPVYPLEFPITSLKYLERTDGGDFYAAMARSTRWVLISIHKLPLLQPRWIPQSSLYFAFWYVSQPILFSLMQEFEDKFYKAAMDSDNTDEQRKIPPKEIMERRIDIWKKYTVRQYEFVSKLSEKPIFFFVQPNQYLGDSKPFSEEEKKAAINERGLDIKHERMFRLKEVANDMVNQGVPIFDLTNIFVDTENTVYVDTCCHINSLGNQLVAERIVEEIRRQYEK